MSLRTAMRCSRTAPLFALAALWLAACATTRPTPPTPGEVVELRGLASWYGDEFAGRPTANGEMFDPKEMTAAHRTFPFGTLVDVTYLRTGRTTRVRVNDRGPFVGNRIIDLSYAAASQLGMVEDGIGEVEIAVVSVGGGDQEPPRPYNVTIPASKPPAESSGAAPAVVSAPPRTMPEPETTAAMQGEPVVITEELPATAALEPVHSAPVRPEPAPVLPAKPEAPPPAPARPEPDPAVTIREGWAVQLGAFSVEANAIELKAQVERIVRPVSIKVSGKLYRVRVGPWAVRSRAIEEKERLEAAGFKAIVVSAD